MYSYFVETRLPRSIARTAQFTRLAARVACFQIFQLHIQQVLQSLVAL